MDGKFWKENGKKQIFGVCLVGWGERKINGGLGCFLPGPTKNFSPQNGEKTKGRKWGYLMDENAHE